MGVSCPLNTTPNEVFKCTDCIIVARSDSTIPTRKCCVRNSPDNSVASPRSASDRVFSDDCDVELLRLAVGLGGPDGEEVTGRGMGRGQR